MRLASSPVKGPTNISAWVSTTMPFTVEKDLTSVVGMSRGTRTSVRNGPPPSVRHTHHAAGRPPSSTALVMVLSGDDRQAFAWRDALQQAGFPVDYAGPSCGDRVRVCAANVIVLDIASAPADAVTAIRQFRDSGHAGYIVALTPPGDDGAIVRCVEAGADACAERSCSPSELVGRIRALVRRARRGEPSDAVGLGDIKINLASHAVMRGEVPVFLTPREYAVLVALARRQGRVVSRAELLAEVWKRRRIHDSHILNATIMSLRHKIESDPTRPRYVVTVRSVGFMASP